MTPVQVSEFIMSLSHPFNATHSGTLRVGSKALKQDYLLQIKDSLTEKDSDALIEFIGASKFVSLMRDQNWGESLKCDLADKLLAAEAAKKEAARELAKREKREKQADIGEDLETICLSKGMEPLAQQKLIINIQDPSNSFLYSPDKDHVYKNHSFKFIERKLEQLFGKKAIALLDPIVDERKISYAPNKGRMFEEKTSRGEIVSTFNKWDPAPWARDWEPHRNGKLPEAPGLFKTLMEVLTGSERDRLSIQAWLRDATFTKADPILVLCGIPGIGKNLFTATLGKALVGENNFKSASRGFSRSMFHSNVADCRLFFLDETPLTRSARETLKDYHSGSAAIERKGIDVGDPEPIHASFILANNDKELIQLEFSDRKFYLPDLNNKSLEIVMGKKEAEKFAVDLIAACQDLSFLQDVANYLSYTFPEGSSRNFYKNTTVFTEVCTASLPSWFASVKNLHELSYKSSGRVVVSSGDVLRGIRHKPSQDQAHKKLTQYAINTRDNFATTILHRDNSWSFIFNPSSTETSPGTSGEELHI
jgi:hypothetical protein